VSAGYGANRARLAELKSTYDPENLFRMNLNITPASEGGRSSGTALRRRPAVSVTHL
jgi:Berberine and berberine like